MKLLTPHTQGAFVIKLISHLENHEEIVSEHISPTTGRVIQKYRKNGHLNIRAIER